MSVTTVEIPKTTLPLMLQGNVLDVLKTLPDKCVQCVVTSPPYFGLRDYSRCECATKAWLSESLLHADGSEGRKPGGSGNVPPNDPRAQKDPDPNCPKCHGTGVIPGMDVVWPDGWVGQLGHEPTPQMFAQHLVMVFREIRRVLRDDGVCWLNLGDSYAANRSYSVPNTKNPNSAYDHGSEVPPGLKPKDLCGIPWRVAFALQDDGWWLRSDVIWAKPNPMPESVHDRPTRSHEYMFLFTKNERYFYDGDGVRQPLAESSVKRYKHAVDTNEQFDPTRHKNIDGVQSPMELLTRAAKGVIEKGSANLRTVWTIATRSFTGAHFATFPPELVRRCVLLGTSEKGACAECGMPWQRTVIRVTGFTNGVCNGCGRPEAQHAAGPDSKSMMYAHPETTKTRTTTTMTADGAVPCRAVKTTGWKPSCDCGCQETTPTIVLDPFAGSGTTLMVARDNGRASIGIELNENYIELQKDRLGPKNLGEVW